MTHADSYFVFDGQSVNRSIWVKMKNNVDEAIDLTRRTILNYCSSAVVLPPTTCTPGSLIAHAFIIKRRRQGEDGSRKNNRRRSQVKSLAVVLSHTTLGPQCLNASMPHSK